MPFTWASHIAASMLWDSKLYPINQSIDRSINQSINTNSKATRLSCLSSMVWMQHVLVVICRGRLQKGRYFFFVTADDQLITFVPPGFRDDIVVVNEQQPLKTVGRALQVRLLPQLTTRGAAIAVGGSLTTMHMHLMRIWSGNEIGGGPAGPAEWIDSKWLSGLFVGMTCSFVKCLTSQWQLHFGGMANICLLYHLSSTSHLTSFRNEIWFLFGNNLTYLSGHCFIWNREIFVKKQEQKIGSIGAVFTKQ